jgi:putative SOS response-associated peptidase YedK
MLSTMCGRYALYVPVTTFQNYFAASCEDLAWAPRYNLAPLQFLPVIRQRPSGERVVQLLRWGLIPSWAKDGSMASKLINARGETVSEKPSFRAAFKARRCIIPASGFYEWQTVAGGKQPYFIQPTEAPVFGFAGVWERWAQPDGTPLDTFSVITTAANDTMQAVHERMPLILQPDDFATWLGREAPLNAVSALIQPCRSALFRMYPVSKAVGNVRNDSAALVLPISTTSA